MSAARVCRKELHILLVVIASLLFSTFGAVPAQAEARKFTISDVMCKSLTCEATDAQGALTTLEIEGDDFQNWAGNNLLFRVYRLVDQNHGDIVIDSKVDVTKKGHLQTNIPVYSLSDGNYYLAFYSASAPGKPLAVGIFTRTSDRAALQPNGEGRVEPVLASGAKAE